MKAAASNAIPIASYPDATPPPQVFYLFGAVPLAWFPLWWALMATTKKESPSPPLSSPPSSRTSRDGRYIQDPLVPSLPSSARENGVGGRQGLTWLEVQRILSRKEVRLFVRVYVCICKSHLYRYIRGYTFVFVSETPGSQRCSYPINTNT